MDVTGRGDRATEQQRVDELRERLRALGYLDAGVDRFVLASAARTHHPFRVALHASARIGLLAGVLLGPAAAIGLAARLPGLVTGPRDAAVAAIYLSVLLGAAAATAAFAAALAASWLTSRSAETGERFARRARTLSVAAGIVVSGASLVYLTLWWQAADGGSGWSAPVWSAFALVVAVAISLLLGHAVTITALATTIARPASASSFTRVPGRRWKATLGGAAGAFSGAAALLFATAGAAPSDTAAALTVRSSGEPLLVLAVDGYDAALRARSQRVPEVASGLLTVLSGPRLRLAPGDSTDPARLWTTIATGRPPAEHGVDGLETRRIAGFQGRLRASAARRVLGGATDVLRLTRPAVASNFERRVKTFWEVAEAAGLRTGIVNWWATWPAPPGGGRVISDRAVLRLDRGGPLDAEIAPPELYPALRTRWPEVRHGAAQSVARYFPSDSAERLAPGIREVLVRSGELDATMLRLAEIVAEGADLDLLVVYLPGLDIAQHALLGTAPAPSELEPRLAGLERYYRFLDAATSPIVERWAASGNVIVLTQPGRLHQGSGVMAIVGRAAARSASGEGTIFDAAPTILHALGIPLSRELDGTVAAALLDRTWLEAHAVRFVDSYGVRTGAAAARGSAPLDQETIERLRSLGYVR